MMIEPVDDMTKPTPLPPRRAQNPHWSAAMPAKYALALAPACGLLLWVALSFMSGRGLIAPDYATFARALQGWSALSAGSPMNTPATINASGAASRALVPLACQSASQSSIGAPLTVRPSEVVCGDVLVVGGDATIQGEIHGSLQVIGGKATITGDVTGDVSVIGGDIVVQNGGQIGGAAHAMGGSVITAPTSIVRNVGSDLQQPRDITRPPGLNFAVDVGSFWLSVVFWMSAALGISLFAPEMVGRVRFNVTHHFMLSGLIGATVAVVSLVLAVILVVTCLGIPIALLVAIAAWAAWVIGTVGVGAWLGSIVFGGPGGRRQPSVRMSAVIGALILCLLKALPVAGVIFGVITGVVALGATILTLLSARRPMALRRVY